MVRQLSELMGGSVLVESEVGRGSTFTVRLPLHVEAPGDGGVPSVTPRRVDDFLREAGLWEAEATTPHRGSERRPGGRPRLVVAEDNVDLRIYLGDVLGDLFDVELVPDGRAAIDAVRRHQPDLIVADVMMPGVGGYELVELVRADPALAGVPVVLLSARAGENETSSGLDAGADDYLVKPFSVVELRARVASNLERAAARTQDSAWRRAVMESLHDGLVITDAEGTVLEVNDRFTTMLGWGAADGPFAPPYPWEEPAAADGLSGAELLRRALASPDHPDPLEGVLRHRDGHPVRVSARVSVVRGTRRQPSLVLCTLRDVTAEHEARQRRHAAARMGAELAADDDLADVLATAVAEFGALFAGEATVRVVVGGRDHVFTPSGPLDPGELDPRVSSALAAAGAEPTAGDGPVPGILLVGGGPAPECRVWVDFPGVRRVAADERIAGDLLVGSFALACDRVVAASSFADRERHLRMAIQSHEEIAQAVGILVERHRWTPAAAFERLKRASQDHNVKLREVARRVIESGADLDEVGADSATGPRRR
jgi:PAS domain S-box-containing protein